MRLSPISGRGAAAAVLALAVAVAGCGPAATQPSSSSPTTVTQPSDTTTLLPAAVPSPVVGVVIAVKSGGLADVTGFTLRTSNGIVLAFRTTGPLENAASFPLGHLAEHLASAAPVRVYFRRSGGTLDVYRIEDAG